MELLFFGLTGGFWFVAFMILFLVSGIVSTQYDNFFWGTLTLVTGLAIMQWVFGVPVWATLYANPLIMLVIASIYLFIGAVYAGFWKFRNYVISSEGKIKSEFSAWVKNSPSCNSKEDFERLVNSDSMFDDYLDSPFYCMAPSKHINKLANWTLMWPFAVIWELSHKPAIWLWNTIYSQLGTLFFEISKSTARQMRSKNKNG